MYIRRHFILLEVLIAMALTMILISILLIFYMQVNKFNSELEKKQDYSFKKLYLSTRLASVLPKAIAQNDPDKDFFFFTTTANDSSTKSGTTALMFAFNNGVKLDSAFANHVLGRLYLSSEGQFCLAIWPSPTRWTDVTVPPIKKEVLFEHVENLTFEFYIPPSKNREIIWQNHKPAITMKKTDLLKLSPIGEWKHEWQQEYEALPYMVRVTLTVGPKGTSSGKQETFTFTYPLPNSPFMIMYE